jgi:hypothetical protein
MNIESTNKINCLLQDLLKNTDNKMFCLSGSDKQIIESLQPNPVNRQESLENQFEGMSNILFTYSDFEKPVKT